MAQIHGWPALEGKVVMHICDNPRCYRYDHLRIGTQQENIVDMNVKGRRASTHGELNPRARLTEEQVTEIRERYAAGDILQRELGIEYGVNQSRISHIITRRNW
jgi:hypothetical protein